MQGSIWFFMAPQAAFPAGVFFILDEAEAWIARHQLSGVLTEYPVGMGVFDWTLETGRFEPKPEKKIDSKFIGQFTSASMAHFHYENGFRLT